MKYAVFGDIHGDLDALLAVLRDAKARRVTGYACLGDIVGGYGDPHGCIAAVRAVGAVCVRGNYDEFIASDKVPSSVDQAAVDMVAWNRTRLTAEDRQWLLSLPYTAEVGGFTITHASLEKPARWGYVFDKIEAAASFNHQTTPVCFFGHIHVPVAFVKDTVVLGGTYSKFRIEAAKCYFISVGSVGQPRDGTRQPTYATYDLEAQAVELCRADHEFTGTKPWLGNMKP